MKEILVYADEQNNKNIFLVEEGKITENYEEIFSKEKLEGDLLRKGSKNITRDASCICRYWKK